MTDVRLKLKVPDELMNPKADVLNNLVSEFFAGQVDDVPHVLAFDFYGYLLGAWKMPSAEMAVLVSEMLTASYQSGYERGGANAYD